MCICFWRWFLEWVNQLLASEPRRLGLGDSDGEKRERERGVLISLFFRYAKNGSQEHFDGSPMVPYWSWQHLWQGFRCDQWCASHRPRCGIRPSSFCLKTTRARWQMQVKQKRLWRPRWALAVSTTGRVQWSTKRHFRFVSGQSPGKKQLNAQISTYTIAYTIHYYPIVPFHCVNTTVVWRCLDTVCADPVLEAVSRGLERGQKDFDDTSLCIGNMLSTIFPLLQHRWLCRIWESQLQTRSKQNTMFQRRFALHSPIVTWEAGGGCWFEFSKMA